MKNKLWILILLLCAPVFAGRIVDPVGDKSNNDKLKAREFNALKNVIINEVNGNLDSYNIKDGSITGDDIQAGTITGDKIDPDTSVTISSVTFGNADYTGTLTVDTLEVSSATVTETLTVTSATITNGSFTSINLGSLSLSSLGVTTLTASSATITNATITTATVTNLSYAPKNVMVTVYDETLVSSATTVTITGLTDGSRYYLSIVAPVDATPAGQYLYITKNAESGSGYYGNAAVYSTFSESYIPRALTPVSTYAVLVGSDPVNTPAYFASDTNILNMTFGSTAVFTYRTQGCAGSNSVFSTWGSRTTTGATAAVSSLVIGVAGGKLGIGTRIVLMESQDE